MLTRRALLGSGAAALAAAGCTVDEEDADVPLPKQLIPIKFAGLDTSKDPKTGASGRLSLLENAQAVRDTDGGVELRKWPGSAAISRTLITSGSVAAGKKVGVLNGAMLMTDGHSAYSYSPTTGGSWKIAGRVADIAAQVSVVEGNKGSNTLDTDVAYCNGFVCFTSSKGSFGGGAAEYYVQSAATGVQVVSGALTSAYNVRVVASATAFFIFSSDGAGNLNCDRVDTASNMAVTHAPVASNVHTSSQGRFDVIWDATNSRIVVGYRNTTPALTLMIWNTGMTAGTSVAYATRDPNNCLGFLDHSFANGSGYLAIATTATGVRVLTFDASSMTVTTDTQLDGAANNVTQVTGYYDSALSQRNVFYSLIAADLSSLSIKAYADAGGGSLFTVRRSVNLASRAFAMDGKHYFLAQYNVSQVQRSIFMIEATHGSSSAAGGNFSCAAVILKDNCSSFGNRASVGSVAVISSTQAIGSFSQVSGGITAAPFAIVQHALTQVSLDWSGQATGNPVPFGGLLYLPCAAAKTWDGQAIVEDDALVYPENPTATQGTGGGITLLGTYTLYAVYYRFDATGRRHDSAVSPPFTVTMTGSNNSLTWFVPTLRMTDADPAYNVNPHVTPWRIALYRTLNGGTAPHLVGYIDNDVTTDYVSFSDPAADSTVASSEILYTTTGEVDNVAPPAILAYAAHRDRLFAISGDGALYFSKDNTTTGSAAGFSDADGFFLDFDQADGVFTGIVSDGTTLFVSKRSRIYLVTGDGPSIDGNNSYSFPQPLPSEVGFLGPRGFCGTPDGIIFKSAKGFHLLDRGGGIQPIAAPAAYDSLTVNGGVATDDRMLAYFFTAEGRTLAWDWRLKQWYTTSASRQPAVACARWQDQVVYLKSDGTVVKEVVGTWGDDGVAYTWKADLTWQNLHRFRIYRALIIGEAMASCTLSASAAYDFDDTLSTAKTIALTTTSPKAPWEFRPSRQWGSALVLHLEETSTTEGVRLSEIDLEVGLKQGAAKYGSGRVMT